MKTLEQYITESMGLDEGKAKQKVAEFEQIVRSTQDIWIDTQKNTMTDGPKSWFVVRYRNAKTGSVDNNRIFLFDPDDKGKKFSTWQEAMKAYLMSGRQRTIVVFDGLPDDLASFIRSTQPKRG